MSVEILRTQTGWDSNERSARASMLVIVTFLDGEDEVAGFFVFGKKSGQMTMAPYFRCPAKNHVAVPPSKFEDCIVPDPNVKHTAYRKTGDNTYEPYEWTGRYMPVPGEGLQFPPDVVKQLESAARKHAGDKVLSL
jgi:hypothetical protein